MKQIEKLMTMMKTMMTGNNDSRQTIKKEIYCFYFSSIHLLVLVCFFRIANYLSENILFTNNS